MTKIYSTTAIAGGDLINDGGSTIVYRGICWDTARRPTIANYRTADTSRLETFICYLRSLTPNTLYYIRAYATNSAGTGYGNQISFTTNSISIPTVTTADVGSITCMTALTGGNIIDDGGVSIHENGICWSTSQNPTISDNIRGASSSSYLFDVILTGLTAATTYYVRAYASSSEGTGYGQQIQFSTSVDNTGQIGTVYDIDGNTYSTIGIGGQTWMAENLKTTKFNDGTSISFVTDSSGWNRWYPEYCSYNGNATYKNTFGALYNGFSVDKAYNGGKNLCPTGWHIPNDYDWWLLAYYLIATGYNYDGTTYDYSGYDGSILIWDDSLNAYVPEKNENKIAKALASSTLWTSSTVEGSAGNTDFPSKRNATGFNAFPGGSCYYDADNVTFHSLIGNMSRWWSTTSGGILPDAGREWYIYYDAIDLKNGYLNKTIGLSVRCIKD